MQKNVPESKFFHGLAIYFVQHKLAKQCIFQLKQTAIKLHKCYAARTYPVEKRFYDNGCHFNAKIIRIRNVVLVLKRYENS